MARPQSCQYREREAGPHEDTARLRELVSDGENLLAETDSGGSTLAGYTLSPELYGALVSQRRSGATSFHHYDALGSSDRLSDASQTAVISYRYRAFGEQTVVSGSSPNRFTWVGQAGYYWQGDTADYWVRHRLQDARAGRWRSRDRRWPESRLASAQSWYVYAANSPAAVTDPSGDLVARVRQWEECRDNKSSLRKGRTLWGPTWVVVRAYVVGPVVGATLGHCFCNYEKRRRQEYLGIYKKECRTVSKYCEVTTCFPHFRCWDEPGPWELEHMEEDPRFTETLDKKRVKGWLTGIHSDIGTDVLACSCNNPGGGKDVVPLGRAG